MRNGGLVSTILCAGQLVLFVAGRVCAEDAVDRMLDVEAVIRKAEAEVKSSGGGARAWVHGATNEAPVSEQGQMLLDTNIASAKRQMPLFAWPGKSRAAADEPAATGSGEVREETLAGLRAELVLKEQQLASANREIERLKDIVRRIQEASRRENIVFHYNKAAIYRANQMYRKAEEEYLAALALDPNDAAVHYNLAVLYDDSLKDKRKAKTHYERFLELAPGDSDAARVREWLSSIVL